jgi:hypothetical protein
VRAREDVDSFVNPIFFITREVLLPWLYHVVRRPCGWLILAVPLMALSLVLDVVGSASIFLIEIAVLVIFSGYYMFTFACCDRWCKEESVFYWPTVIRNVVESWVTWAGAFRYTTEDTLLLDRDALDSAEYAAHEHPKFALFVRECFFDYSFFYFTRALYFQPGDTVLRWRRRKIVIFGLILLFPILVVCELVALLYWWACALTLLPVYLPFFFLTAGCCHRRWTLVRLFYYYMIFLATLMAVSLFGTLIVFLSIDPLVCFVAALHR